ncbi:PssE/Cps14G family polysaccharide biosynthesis glycosyltransferase [uncultured Vibrio sp.]|uniref:PssE/Cps14G family polysaccharide biosynthesis glycosyltransferase n=1 Tax=uncultured Vibrio sp. TaxID=114054 RepID=UPI00262B777B|nr:PssE/Cps14G family polysaccharide biosynthesis glycosyltransferase [uncultured Vibrio sp.]
MIFVTVGTQLPFDRLIKEVDKMAEITNEKFICQVGESKYIAKNIDCKPFYEPDSVMSLMNDCEFIIAHAGMGSIISAIQLNKSIIVVPRQIKYNEHRNDHQIATAELFRNTKGVYVCDSLSELSLLIQNKNNLLTPTCESGEVGLAEAIKVYIES